jgi:chemotaxis protein CheC
MPLSDQQLGRLVQAFHRGVSDSAAALRKWLARPAAVTIESVDQCSLDAATQVLGGRDDVACMCQMRMQGALAGQLLLAFDDASGLTLADILLSKSPGTSAEWGDVEISAALETMNIVGSAYLNGIAHSLSQLEQRRISLIPTPPAFLRDYMESLLESAFVEQADAGNCIVFAETRFELQNQPLRWTFLLIPDSASLVALKRMLSESSA